MGNEIKPSLTLIGEDGNGMFILGRAQGAAKEAGWSKEKIATVMKDAMSGNYAHLLQTIRKHFDCDQGEI
jgi:hypothetical protein